MINLAKLSEATQGKVGPGVLSSLALPDMATEQLQVLAFACRLTPPMTSLTTDVVDAYAEVAKHYQMHAGEVQAVVNSRTDRTLDAFLLVQSLRAADEEQQSEAVSPWSFELK